MSRLLRLSVFGLILFATGCRTCDDRPRPFQRLRDAFDRDDNHDFRSRDRDRNTDRLAAAPVPGRMGDPCLPCVDGRTIGGVGYGGELTGWSGPVVSGPILSGPIYSGGTGTLLPSGTYTPRDNELPLPGGYSQPRETDYGRTAPRPPNSFTGR